MTTAHRPTWKPAVGRENTGGWSAGGAAPSRTATLDLPAHLKLKFRKDGPVDRKKAVRDSILKLKEAEATAMKKKIGKIPVNPEMEHEGRLKLLKQSADVDEERIRSKYNDDDNEDGAVDDEDGWSDLDGEDSDSSNDDSDDDSDDDEDDEAALQAELAKIRAEREAVKAKEKQEIEKQEEEELEEAALVGNPLLAGGGSITTTGKLKRKWNDDVVFRNQARDEPEVKKRFINDTIRNDFHRKFLNKFIK